MENYRPLLRKPNVSHSDRLAIRWLREHRGEVAVCDVDKGLGDAPFPRKWVSDKITVLLTEAFVQISREEYQSLVHTQRNIAMSAVISAQHAESLPHQTVKYLEASSRTGLPGSFRLRPKIHKTPIGARPVANLTASWIQPFAIMLTEYLIPIQKTGCSVICNTDEAISRFQDFNRSSKKSNLADEFLLGTIDAVNMYPSLCQKHLYETVGNHIDAFYGHKPILADCLIKVLHVILSCQVIAAQGSLWHCKQGIATGLAAGSLLANIYLLSLDRKIASMLTIFLRYIDDSFVLGTRKQINAAIEELNRFHVSLRWEPQQLGTHSIAFLDTSLSFVNNEISWGLLFKPMNKFLYVPFNSCHPTATKNAIVFGEITRALRRCRFTSDALKHIEVLRTKFISRGYGNQLFNDSLLRALRTHDQPVTRCNAVRRHFVSVVHSSTTNYRLIRRACQRLGTPVLIAKRAQKSIFRLMYRSNWLG